VVCQSVSLPVACLRCAKTADRIEVLFGVQARLGPRNIVLEGGSDLRTAKKKESEMVSMSLRAR